VRFTTLGTGTISLSSQRTCSGYLLEADDLRLLIDCGSGITRRLAERGDEWRTITHVAITHFHIDHHGDLPTLVFAWKYGQLPPRSAPLQLIGPVGTAALLDRLATAYGDWLRAPGFPIGIREIAPGEAIELSPSVRLSALKVPHTPESVAYSIEHGGRRVVYTGDTGPDEALGDWARGCDLLVCECSLPSSMAIKEHLTPEQCAALAERAQPGHVVLTHFYPPVENVDILATIRERYDGYVTLANDGWEIEIDA